jgi:hypothetical protein
MAREGEFYAELAEFDKVSRLSMSQFPAVDFHDPIDNVINQCWFGKFEQVAGLSREIKGSLPDMGTPDDIKEIEPMSVAKYAVKKELYNGLYSLLLEEEVP